MMSRVGPRKPRRGALTIEFLENRNLLTVSPAHGVRASVIDSEFKSMIEKIAAAGSRRRIR